MRTAEKQRRWMYERNYQARDPQKYAWEKFASRQRQLHGVCHIPLELYRELWAPIGFDKHGIYNDKYSIVKIDLDRSFTPDNTMIEINYEYRKRLGKWVAARKGAK